MERCLRRRNIYIPQGVPNASEVFLFSEKKVRRGFLTHRTTINHTTRGKPLRLQKLSFLIGLASSALLWKAKAFVVANIAYYAMSPLRAGTLLTSYFVDI